MGSVLATLMAQGLHLQIGIQIQIFKCMGSVLEILVAQQISLLCLLHLSVDSRSTGVNTPTSTQLEEEEKNTKCERQKSIMFNHCLYLRESHENISISRGGGPKKITFLVVLYY